MAYTAAPRDPPPQSQGFRSISPQPGYPIQHPTQIQIPPQFRYPHQHQQPRPPPTSFPNPAPTRRPLPTPKSRPESLPPPARAAQTPAPSRPAPIPAPAPSRPAILAHTASLESTNINNHTRRPLPNPGAKSTKHASLDLRAQLEHNPAEPGLNSAVSSQTSASSFSPFSPASGASSFSSSAPSSAAQSSAFSNYPPSSAYPNTPPSASFRNTPSHNFSGPGPASSYPHVTPLIDVRALPLSSAPAKFTPHWKRDLPGPVPPPQPDDSSSRVGPFMERRSTVSGSAAPLTPGATNGFPTPATLNNYPFARSVSPERNPTSVIDRAQAAIHRAQTQTSSGRRPLPSIGNRSPPVPPLPGSSRSPPQPSSSRSPPVPGSSRSPPAIPGSQSQPVPSSSRWPPEPGSSRGPPIPDGFRSPPVMSPRPPPISGSSRSPVPASSFSQMARTTSNAPSTSSTLTDFSHSSSSTMRSMHTRMPATTDDESNPSDVGDECDEKFDGRQEERGYGNRREDYRQQHGRYNEQKEAHRERDIRSAGEPSNVSPQYGIRDLPRHTRPSQPSQPKAHIQERQWTRTRPTRAATLPTPPSQSPNDIQDNEPQSLTLRMAALGLSPSQSPSHTQSDISRHPSMHSSMQSSRSSSPSFDLGSHPLLQHVPSTAEQELDNLSKRPPLQRGKSVIEGLQRHPFVSAPVERRVSGRSRSLVREQEYRSMSPAREQSPIHEPSPTRSQWPQNIPPLPRAPLSPAGASPFSPECDASGSGGDANSSPTRSAFARPASPLKNSVFHTSGFSRPTSPSKSPLPTPPNSTFARAEAGGTPVFSSPRKASGGKGPSGSQNQNSRSNSPQKSSNAYASPTLPSLTSPPKLAYLSNSSARNAFPPSAFPSSFPTSSSHPTTSNSHIMERQRQKQRAYVSTYDLDDEPPVSPLRERVGLPSPSASRSPSPSDFGARMGGRSVSRGLANKDQGYGYCNEDDGDERSPSPIRFAKRSSTQFSVLEMDFVGGQDVPRRHRTPASRSAGGRADDEDRRADMGMPAISLPGGHVDFDQDSDNGGGAAVSSSKTHESPPRIAVSSATPPRVTGSRATPPRVAVTSSTPPRVAVNASTPPRIAVSGSSPPRIAVSGSSPSPPQTSVSSPSIRQASISSPSTPKISVSIPSSSPRQPTSWHASAPSQEPKRLPPPPGQTGLRGAGGQNNVFNAQSAGKISGVLSGMRGNGLSCAGCGGPIIGRIVSAMGQRWHPACFCCSACNELLEHVSSFEHEGKPYCHLDYHENFAPRCYHCKTAIIDEQFITLDDEALGKRTYHKLHFFCAECGDPFLPPSSGNGGLTVTGDGEFDLDDDVGFTVYKGHPYCEACHVRLRMPKCKGCKKSIRDGMRAVEALGGKWCWECFVCEGCKKPFEDPSFFLRENKPFCEPCFSLILRNEV